MSGRARKLALGVLTALMLAASARAQSPPPELGIGPVYWIPIDDGPHATRGMIDDWTYYFVDRYIAKAQEEGASAIVFAIRTYGGESRAAEAIADAIIAVEDIPTIAYVDGRAISAGALIALACHDVYMRENSTMGDVQAVMITEEGPKPLGEKIDTHMRARFRMQARRRADRVPYEEQYLALFEAMTDVSVEVVRVRVDDVETFVRRRKLDRFIREREDEGKTVTVLDTVVHEGELLTMDSTEALNEYRIIDGIVKDRGALLDLIGKAESDVVETVASWPQEIARFIGGNLISGLLISIAMLGLLMELYAPGKGIGGFIFLIGIILFFWSHFLAGQAGPVEVVLFLVGVGLLAAEIFLIPGFGVAGISGIVLVVASLVLAFLPGDVMPETPAVEFPWDSMWDALTVVLLSLLGAIVGIGVLARYLPGTPMFGALMTKPPGLESVTASVASSGKPLESYVGKRGVTSTDLRPSGKVAIGSDVIDAVAEGEFIPKDTWVRVTEAAGNRAVVTQAGAEPDKDESGAPPDTGGVA
jgi:membrane-bound serine protease (ClpP class)